MEKEGVPPVVRLAAEKIRELEQELRSVEKEFKSSLKWAKRGLAGLRRSLTENLPLNQTVDWRCGCFAFDPGDEFNVRQFANHYSGIMEDTLDDLLGEAGNV